MRTAVMTMREPTRSSVIERQIATGFARDTVAKALYDVILDGVEHGPRDLSTSEDREWIRGAIALPIQEATELALHDLARRLAQAFERAPNGWLVRFDTSHRGPEVGPE